MHYIEASMYLFRVQNASSTFVNISSHIMLFRLRCVHESGVANARLRSLSRQKQNQRFRRLSCIQTSLSINFSEPAFSTVQSSSVLSQCRGYNVRPWPLYASIDAF